MAIRISKGYLGLFIKLAKWNPDIITKFVHTDVSYKLGRLDLGSSLILILGYLIKTWVANFHCLQNGYHILLCLVIILRAIIYFQNAYSFRILHIFVTTFNINVTNNNILDTSLFAYLHFSSVSDIEEYLPLCRIISHRKLSEPFILHWILIQKNEIYQYGGHVLSTNKMTDQNYLLI